MVTTETKNTILNAIDQMHVTVDAARDELSGIAFYLAQLEREIADTDDLETIAQIVDEYYQQIMRTANDASPHAGLEDGFWAIRQAFDDSAE